MKRSARPPAEKSLRLTAYDEVRRLILTAELQPGTAVSEYRLAGLLRLSRTPVREALKQLEQEGLVKTFPQRGSFVSELTVRDIFEIYQLRELLECSAAAVAASRMPMADADELLSALDAARRAAKKGQKEDAFNVDVALHRKIIEVMRNRRLEAFLDTLKDQVHRIRYLSPKVPGRLASTLAEHSKIVKAIKARDPRGAEVAMRRHLVAARENAIRILMPYPMVTPPTENYVNGLQRFEIGSWPTCVQAPLKNRNDLCGVGASANIWKSYSFERTSGNSETDCFISCSPRQSHALQSLT